MARNNDESRYDRILERIKNLRLPLLTLDRKWYLLFDGNKPKQIQETENELNEVIKSESRIKAVYQSAERNQTSGRSDCKAPIFQP